MNPPANNEHFLDFDFDALLRDASIVPPQSTGSSRASPPPAPRLSNLTTPTTFSPVSSAHDEESSVDGTEVSTPIDGGSLELRVEEEASRDQGPWDEFRAGMRGERWEE